MTSLVICSTSFATLGRAQLAAMGCPDTPIAIVPHPFGLRTRDEVRAIAEECAREIARLAVQGDPNVGHHTSNVKVERARELEVPEDLDAFNALCLERRWADGFPVIPPTADRVQRMLRGSQRAATDVIAHVAPGFGPATVERIAINAVMAGCRPEYLPVVITAVEATSEKRFNLQGIQATTNPAGVFIVVNGPITGDLAINGGWNCLGQGSQPNATIGRALRLVMQNVGGARPAEMDRATHGFPGKYSFCCAENEAANPWEPLHVERGFEPRQGTVTVIGAAGTLNMNSHAKDADDLIRIFADSMTFPTSNDYHFGGQPWLVISPEHAEILSRGGLSKKDVKQRLWAQSKMSASRFAAKDFARAHHTRAPELGEITKDTPMPISLTPEDIGIIVAGGPGTHSVYVPTFGQTRAATRVVES